MDNKREMIIEELVSRLTLGEKISMIHGTGLFHNGGVHLTKEAATSGLDLEMSVTDNFDEYCMAEPLKKAVENGEIAEELIDKKVKNILRLMYRLHMLGKYENATADENEKFISGANADKRIEDYGNNFDKQNANEDGEKSTGAATCKVLRKPGSYNTPEHRQKILDAARESIILLKNEKNQLPLSQKKTKKVFVIGDNANRIQSYGGIAPEILEKQNAYRAGAVNFVHKKHLAEYYQ